MVDENSENPSDHIALAIKLAHVALQKFDRKASLIDHDLYGEAMLGLVLASKDYGRGKKSFATWAQYKISGQISNFIEKESVYRRKKTEFNELDTESRSVNGRHEKNFENLSDLHEILDHIGGKEADILRERAKGRTLADIGVQFGIGRERVRQLEERGISMVQARIRLRQGAVWA
jgi:RNA polymerase sigma factor (sigma-70 family)